MVRWLFLCDPLGEASEGHVLLLSGGEILDARIALGSLGGRDEDEVLGAEALRVLERPPRVRVRVQGQGAG